MQQIKGTGIAIITPFTPGGDIDFQALERLVEFWITGGVEYLVVMGTTGESVTLTAEEKVAVYNLVVKQVRRRVPVVLGVGGNNTSEVIRAFGEFDLSGAAAILSVSPYYNKPTQEGIFQHFRAVAAASPLPVILYNVPGRTGSNMLPSTTLRLAREVPNIAAVKEASGNVEQIMEIIRDKPEGFLVISGDDAITLPLVAAGADGVISVVANAYPREFSDMVRFTAAADLSSARPLHYRLTKIISHLFTEGNPAGVKAVMKQLGLCDDYVRLPLTTISDELLERIKKSMDIK